VGRTANGSFPGHAVFIMVRRIFWARARMASTSADPPGLLWPIRGLGALLDVVAASHARAVAALVVVCLISYLPGFFNIPPIDRDEARFVQATKQMLETGDYVDIRFQDEVRYKKPVGIYWLQAAAVRAAQALGVADPRTSVWVYRLPSLVGATGGVLLTYWAALAFGTRRMAYVSGLILGCSLLLGVEARLAKTDAMLLLATVAAMGALARVYLERSRFGDAAMATRIPVRSGAELRAPTWSVEPAFNSAVVTRRTGDVGLHIPVIFWTALAGGVLLKGPIILMIVGISAACLASLERSWRWLASLRPGIGVVALLALVLPWFIAIVARTRGGFITESLGQDLLGKVAGGQESHGAPPGTYFLLFWVTFWPGAPLAAMAAPTIWKERRDPSTRFLLAWLLPSWLVFELVMTKLPHYVLPLYPAVAILIARSVERNSLSTNPRLVRATVLWPLVAAGLPTLGVLGVIIFRHQLALLAWAFAAAAIIFGFLAWRLYEADGAERSLLRATVAAQLMSIAVLGATVPLMRPLFPSTLLASTIGVDCPHPQFASAGYHEPSLVFLFGTSTLLTTGPGAADFLAEGNCRFAMIEARQERAFVQRAEAIGLRYAPGPRVAAINYSAGRQIAISVFRSEIGE
jgi:4-amino-4-deoxy-L-arabinose transferase-like glycosyltransferase